MDQSNQYCELCRRTVIDLYSLKAYYQPGDWVYRTVSSPSRQELASKYPPFFRSVTEFNSDCPVCQVIWSAVRHDKLKTPVRAVQLLAEDPEDDEDIVDYLKSFIKTPLRNASFWLGYRQYFPVSILEVIPWHCGEEPRRGELLPIPEAFEVGARRQLRIFAEPGTAIQYSKPVGQVFPCLSSILIFLTLPT